MYLINTSLRFLFEGPHGTVLCTGNLKLFSEQVCNFKDAEAENCSHIITCSWPSLSRCHVTFCYNYIYHDMYVSKSTSRIHKCTCICIFLEQNYYYMQLNWKFGTFVAFQ